MDDYDHFNSVVSIDGGFSMYERVLRQRGARSLMRRFDEASHFKLNCCTEIMHLMSSHWMYEVSGLAVISFWIQDLMRPLTQLE